MNKVICFSILLTVSKLLSAQINPGHIGSDQTICYGSAPQVLSFSVQPSGGTLPYALRWQRSNDNGTNWYDISGTSASRTTYYPPVLGRTTLFRCRVTDSGNSYVFTNHITVTVSANLSAGNIGSSQTIFKGTTPSPIVQLTEPEGGSGSYSYQWQLSHEGSEWEDIQGATSIGYTPPPIIDDTWFRRWVFDGTCGSTVSNSVRITTNQITLYTSEVPSVPAPSWQIRNLGTEFEVLIGGFITAVRLYTDVNEAGVHQIRLWRQNDNLTYDQILPTINWTFPAGTTGWREYMLPSAVQVEANRNYIVSISNDPDNRYWVQLDNNLIPATSNNFVKYIRGLINDRQDQDVLAPFYDEGLGYFRDIVFIPFTSGSIGGAQSICYNTLPSPLVEITNPTGGAGQYTYQWQESVDNLTWTNIVGATEPRYSPSELLTSTYYRRATVSGPLTIYSSPVLITVDQQFNSAQLQGAITIYKNTSTFFNVEISGGTPPYTIEYTRNAGAPTQISNYTSGAEIYTGILTEGTYNYELTSVTDALGCHPLSLGSSIQIYVDEDYSPQSSNKALVIVNSGLASPYQEYFTYIKPYLDWFGIPYETCDLNNVVLPALSNYAVIILGHRNILTGNLILSLQDAIWGGVGLYSFDPSLLNFPANFNTPGGYPEVTSSQIHIITDPLHYITEYHINDIYNTGNDIVNLNYLNDPIRWTITVGASDYSLANGNTLATMSDVISTAPLLQATNYGSGRIVAWSEYNWVNDYFLGPVYGMDDLIWRGIVWAARKPFVMQGLPPMVTMRVDDVDGTGSSPAYNLEWINISNEFGFIPWCGIFTENLTSTTIATLRDLINNNLATASPHAFSYENYIYYNIHNEENFDPAARVGIAKNFFINNQLTMSRYMIAHSHLISEDALAAIADMGIEYMGTPILYDQGSSSHWLMCGPYRINRDGYVYGNQPLYYAAEVSWPGLDFFNSQTEIRDDGGYEWYPTSDVTSTTARGIRHLRRALNSMVLPTLFTHEFYLGYGTISSANLRQILGEIASVITSSYHAEFMSMDEAVKYVRAKTNVVLTNITDDGNIVNISCTGDNDMQTQCYLFTGSDNQITFRLITIPEMNSVPITVGVLK